MKIIAHIYSDLTDKFGIPRQSNLVRELTGKIIFEPEFRVKEAFEGLEEFSHIWILWQFSEAVRDNWSPTVRPPRLGGEKRKGVFATRSPFRPNNIGLSCVRLEKIEFSKDKGPVLTVSGIDIMNGTPIYDIKPYIAYTDSQPHASQGFAEKSVHYRLKTDIPDELLSAMPEEKIDAIKGILSQDPRPAYHKDPNRIYGLSYAGYNIRFKVEGDIVKVIQIIKPGLKYTKGKTTL